MAGEPPPVTDHVKWLEVSTGLELESVGIGIPDHLRNVFSGPKTAGKKEGRGASWRADLPEGAVGRDAPRVGVFTAGNEAAPDGDAAFLPFGLRRVGMLEDHSHSRLLDEGPVLRHCAFSKHIPLEFKRGRRFG